MEWLSATTGLIAAGITVPLLVLMYFLKLRRNQVPISSTLLWKRAVEDLRVNAPFQRLRRNILLLLQLLALAAALLALAGPILTRSPGEAKRYVLLIDRSASMNTREEGGKTTRLAMAKAEARKIVNSIRSRTSLTLQDASDQAMVIAFADHPKVMSNFTSDQRQLLRAIDAIEPSDGGSSLSEAITVARAFATPGEGADARGAERAADLDLFSDGRIKDIEKILLNPEEVFYHMIGQAGENVAVVAMEARRSYERAREVSVFATLANYAKAAATCDVELSLDGDVRAVRSVTIPPRAAGEHAGPGRTSVTFSLTHDGAGIVGVRQCRADALAVDDAAWAILPPPKKLAVLLVTTGNFGLESALKACALRQLEVVTPAEFRAKDHAAMSVQQPYDVIVLDRPAPEGAAPESLPHCRYLVFGRPPDASGVKSTKIGRPRVMVDWREQHPVLQHLNLANVVIARGHKLELPRDAVVLAEFAEAPCMAAVSRRGSVFVLVGFDVMDTNWPFLPSFVMFCYNTVHYLGMEVAQSLQRSLGVGEAITVRGEVGGPKAKVTGPGKLEVDVAPDVSGTLRFAGTRRVGIYSMAIPDRPAERFAVNLLDADESDIAPAAELSVSGDRVAPQTKTVRSSAEELWPLLVAAALLLACVEWFVYNSKVRL